ncbi:MAG TPA: hypothetical protein PKY72_03150 [Bacilli bacterium]|jgi:hypothetical protein|nr:hypothetical protein [Bacilli bacterium]HQQ39273.1 hypothetical protein [Bacilli bacterium]
MSAKIKLHLNYFFNKVNLFIFLSSLVLILIAILAIVSDLDPNIYSINQYYQSSYLLFSIFSNSFACFLFSFNYLKEQDEYRYLIVLNNKDKISYLTSKLLVSILILILFHLIVVLIINVLGFIFLKVTINSYYLKISINTLFLNLLFGFMSLILIKVSNRILIIFVPLFVSFMINFIENKSFKKIVSVLFPVLDNNFLFNCWHFLFLYFVCLVIIYFLEVYLDY